MGEEPNKIVEEIEEARTSLDRHLDAFEERVKLEADWHVQFERHPWAVLSMAFVVGLVIARVMR
jgi:ElaB/YqjD/DUF883 family membrane-anchored ribosome-binding protein